MRSHELAKLMLEAPDGEISVSVDLSNGDQSTENHRCFTTEFVCVNGLPTDVGFGSDEVRLLFMGYVDND